MISWHCTADFCSESVSAPDFRLPHHVVAHDFRYWFMRTTLAIDDDVLIAEEAGNPRQNTKQATIGAIARERLVSGFC